MQNTYSLQRHLAGTIAAGLIAVWAVLPSGARAAGTASFELRPHCYQEAIEQKFGGPLPDAENLVRIAEESCTSFEVRDPQNKQTPVLSPGSVIDMDLVIHNPDRLPVSRFRAWIAYDASVLEGVEADIASGFPSPTPGEEGFAKTEGFIKLSGSSNAPIAEELIVVARMRFTVMAPVFEGTPLTFFDASGTVDSKSGIFEKAGSTETNVMMSNPGYLYVRFSTQGGTQSAASASVAPAGGASSAPAAGAPSAVFTMLQVQGLRVTTEGSSVFLAWDSLPSMELVGYNLYYGTTTGRYIQRRSVDKDAISVTIRGLPVGTTYYFAVRGVNAAGSETEFSQEVAVSVGNPRTSTSPLSADSIPTKTPGTGGSVAGDTGISSTLLIVLVLSAVVGTFIALRRQSSL